MQKTILFLFLLSCAALLYSSPVVQEDPVGLKEKADTYFSQRNYDSAAVFFGEAALAFQEIPDVREYLSCRNMEAYSLGLKKRDREAIVICEQVMNEYPDSLQAIRLDVYFYWKLARYNHRLGNYLKAYANGLRTREIAESYGIFLDNMKNDILEILTTAARRIGLYDSGLGFAYERMEYNKSKGDFLNLSHAYNSMALIYKRFHDKRRALEYFKKCIEIREKYAPRWTPYVTINVGEMYLGMGKMDSARVWYQRTLDILSAQGVKENLLYSALYSSLAVISSRQDDYSTAIDYIDKCLAIRARFYPAESMRYTDFLKIKAEILIKAGELAAAHEILEQFRITYSDENLSPQNVSRYHQWMASYYEAAKQVREAIGEHQQSIILLSRDFGDMDILQLPLHDDVFYGKDMLLKVIIRKASLINDLYRETADPKYLRSVLDHYHFALGLIDLMIEDQSGMLSVSELFKDFNQLYETAIKVSVSLNELFPDDDIYRSISSYMEANRMNHAKILYRLNQVINYGGIPDSVLRRRTELEEIVLSQSAEQFQIEQELDRIHFLVKSASNEHEYAHSGDVDLLRKAQRKLHGNGMILQYYFGEEDLYLLATSRTSNNLLTLKWGDQEQQDLSKFIHMMRLPGNGAGMALVNKRVFHSLGLDVVLGSDIHEIVVIPDRELYFVPFDALKDETDQYLLANYTIYTENSLFLMSAPGKKVKKGIPLLALAPFAESMEGAGIPDSERRGLGMDLNPLPGSEVEIETIHDLFGGVMETGLSATEGFFKENAQNSKIIHLSSHSYLDDEDPFFNSIVLAPGPGTEDGYLQTHELYGLNLNTELLTLSACNTGLGSYMNGEGMISLATGFRSAGVKNIVMSLWSLPDDATSTVMKGFYAYLKAGKPKAEALRQAKLDYLEDADLNMAAPYFWAATVLTGKNTSLVSGSRSTLFYGGIGLIILLLFIQYRYRRRSK